VPSSACYHCAEGEVSTRFPFFSRCQRIALQQRGEQWLRQLLDVLEGKTDAAEQQINPFPAITIDPLFAIPHPPLIEGGMWIDVNLKQMRNMGVEGWLRQLLDVLSGDVVTAGEVGFAPPGDPFGYGVPGRSTRQRRGKKRRKKRHHR
jgi:hypothetical protein